MMTGSGGLSASDVALLQGRNNANDGFFGGGGTWIWVLLIFAIFMGWGNFGGGFGGGGAAQNYVLNSDFATLQRQLSDGFNSQERRTDSIINGICDLGYTQQSLANTTNMAIAQNGYESRLATTTLGNQLATCCCDIRQQIGDVNYNIATQANGIARQIEKGFSDTNYAMASQNCQTLQAIDKVGDRVIDYLSNQETQRLRDEIAMYRDRANSQYIVNEINKCPMPSYLVANPYGPLNYTNCANSCGCGCNQ